MLIPLFRRALAWLRRNPDARADALELAAQVARGRAERLDLEGRTKAAQRARARALVLDTRAQQLRSTIDPVPPPRSR